MPLTAKEIRLKQFGKTGRLGALLWHSRWQTRGHCFLSHPTNPSKGNQKSWWHARDYGLISANPFAPKKSKGMAGELLPKANPSDSVIKLSFTPLTTMRLPKLRKGLLSIRRHRHTQPPSCPHTLATPRIISPRKSNPAFLNHEVCLV